MGEPRALSGPAVLQRVLDRSVVLSISGHELGGPARRWVDVVFPESLHRDGLVDLAQTYSPMRAARTRAAPAARNVTLSFAGMVRDGDKMPNGHCNARFLAIKHLGRVPGFSFHNRGGRGQGRVDGRALTRSSHFCLCATGNRGGYDVRVVEAVYAGCIPVIVDTHATEKYVWPLEQLLPYDRFSVRVACADLAGLPARLAAISPAQREDMRRELLCARRAFEWSSVDGTVDMDPAKDGPGVFASVLEILRRRVADGPLLHQLDSACDFDGGAARRARRRCVHALTDPTDIPDGDPRPSCRTQKVFGRRGEFQEGGRTGTNRVSTAPKVRWLAGGAACAGLATPPCD